MIASTIRNTSTTNNAGFPPHPEAHQRAVAAEPRQHPAGKLRERSMTNNIVFSAGVVTV
jgi:hypothetical protein